MVRQSKWVRAATVGTVMLTGTTLFAACGSSKSGTATSPTSGASSSATTAAGGGGAASATASYVKTYESAPSSIPITTPLKAAPPKGKTFVFMECDIAQCTQEANALKAVTAAIDWKLKVIPYQSANPATLISGMQQALQDDPAGVGLSGIPEVEWESVVPAYEKAGVPIVEAYVGPQVLNKTIIANIGDNQSVSLDAKALADYFAVNSDGKGKILQFEVPDYPILEIFDEAFRSDVAAVCPGCKITQLDGTIAEADGGTTAPAMVSALQRDPSIGWVVTDDGPWVDGLPSAASAAGIHVKVIGEGADVADEADIKSGTMTAFTALALNYGEWAMVDAVLRHLEGMPIPATEGTLPTQLLTKGESFAVSESYDEPADYASLMKKLWHEG